MDHLYDVPVRPFTHSQLCYVSHDICKEWIHWEFMIYTLMMQCCILYPVKYALQPQLKVMALSSRKPAPTNSRHKISADFGQIMLSLFPLRRNNLLSGNKSSAWSFHWALYQSYICIQVSPQKVSCSKLYMKKCILTTILLEVQLLLLFKSHT